MQRSRQKCPRVLCVPLVCGARALWGARSGRDGAGRGISAAQTPPAGAAGGPRAGVVAVATSARRGVSPRRCRPQPARPRGGPLCAGAAEARGAPRRARPSLEGRPAPPRRRTVAYSRVQLYSRVQPRTAAYLHAMHTSLLKNFRSNTLRYSHTKTHNETPREPSQNSTPIHYIR